MLAEMRNDILGKIYPEFEASRLQIYLVDATPTVLPPMREKSQKYTYKALEKIGVKVMLGKMVQDYKDEVVYFKDGDTIETKTLIWTARSEEHTSELQSRGHLVCRLLLEKKKHKNE